jgi:hypothetical protein
MAMPTPRTKNLPKFNGALRILEESSYEAATAGKGGVRTIERYPSISRISAMISVFARPSFVAKALIKKAATIKPAALHKNIMATVP